MHNAESPCTDDKSMEKRLSAAPEPRVRLADVEANIVHSEIVKHVSQSGQILRWAVLTARNGFAVTGDPSAAVSPANDDAALGESLAVKNARDQLWRLMGYALKERLYQLQDGDVVTAIARACHEVNRGYCQFLGDDPQPAWEDAPQWQKDSAMNGVRMHIAHPEAGPQASHASWYVEKEAAGWKYGPVKDPEKKEHPCMVPFEELPREQQAKDWIFRAVVYALGGMVA